MTRIDENLVSSSPPAAPVTAERAATAELSTRVLDQEQMLDSVRLLHSRDAAGWCVGCGYQWPCATTRAVQPDVVRQ